MDLHAVKVVAGDGACHGAEEVGGVADAVAGKNAVDGFLVHPDADLDDKGHRNFANPRFSQGAQDDQHKRYA